MQDKSSKTSTPPSFLYIIVGILLAAVIILIISVINLSRTDHIRQSITVGGVIKPLQELTTVEYSFDAVAPVNKKVLFLEEEELVVYSSRIKAGFDMSEIKIEEDPKSKTAVITMPELKILSKESPYNTRSYNTKSAAFVEIHPDQAINEINAAMDEKCEELLKDEHFITTARSQAELAITAILSANPETSEYKITFNYQ